MTVIQWREDAASSMCLERHLCNLREPEALLLVAEDADNITALCRDDCAALHAYASVRFN